jgi:hypothetical protein
MAAKIMKPAPMRYAMNRLARSPVAVRAPKIAGA